MHVKELEVRILVASGVKVVARDVSSLPKWDGPIEVQMGR
jgi:hypothetical protein